MKVKPLEQPAGHHAGQLGPDGAGPFWLELLGEIAASGSNYAMSHQAMRLFTALGANDANCAVTLASTLADMARERGLLTTREAATALKDALLSEGGCDAMTVKHACAELIEDMIVQRLINTIPCRTAPSN